MQVITSIYLNCRPDLRDEWLTGNEVDDLGEGQVNFYFTETRDPRLKTKPVSGTGTGASSTRQVLLR